MARPAASPAPRRDRTTRRLRTSPSPVGAAGLIALGLACGPAPRDPAPASGLHLSPESIAALEARIDEHGAAAAPELVALVVASPVDLPPGELARLGRLLLARSDPAALLERLRELAVAHPESGELEAWLAELIEYERSILRGVDVEVGY